MSQTSLLRALLLSLAFAFTASAHAQLSHEGPARIIALSQTLQPYDVVSIKSVDEGDPTHSSWGMGLHDTIFTANNVRLVDLIEFAYDVKEDIIYSLTGPATSPHFDIEAKILPSGDGPPTKLKDTQLRAMIVLLLADRFHLKAHLETKTLPVYDLVVAHGGPKFQLDPSELTGGGWNINGSDFTVILTSKTATMPDLADMLADPVHRRVIDKTGLTGHTPITLKWTPDDMTPPGNEPTISIFTAVEEQLGLKLQSSKGPVETLVIDHVDLPSKN